LVLRILVLDSLNDNLPGREVDLPRESLGLFRTAAELQRNGNTKLALEKFEQLAKNHPDSIAVLTSLAGLYWETESLELALLKLESVVNLEEDYEPASVAMFHCLWELERFDEAFSEAKRFCKLGYSLSDDGINLRHHHKTQATYLSVL